MTALKDWLLGVTAAALAISLAQALTPEGTIKKIGALAGALVLLLAALHPLAGWTGDLPGLPVLPVDPAGAEQASESGEEIMKSLIAQKAGAYIVDKGQALGVRCAAEVTVAPDASGWPVPWEVRISGNWTAQQKRMLAQAVEEELGIPAQRQSFREEGT